MLEVVSLIYKLPNGLHRTVSNLTFAEATASLLEHLKIDDPKADFAVGIIQTEECSATVELAQGSTEELMQILYKNKERMLESYKYLKAFNS